MLKPSLLKIAPILLITATLTGCAMFNKGTLHYNRTTTIGKELIDLKEAQKCGILTEEEYIDLKKEVMKGGPILTEGCK